MLKAQWLQHDPPLCLEAQQPQLAPKPAGCEVKQRPSVGAVQCEPHQPHLPPLSPPLHPPPRAQTAAHRLSNEPHYDFGMRSLKGVLLVSAQLRTEGGGAVSGGPEGEASLVRTALLRCNLPMLKEADGKVRARVCVHASACICTHMCVGMLACVC